MTRARRTRWLLFASLALNLLVLGMVIGWVASPDGPRREDRAARSVMGAPFVEALTRPERRELLRHMRRAGDRIEGNRAELRARFEALIAALSADDWDRSEVEALLDAQRGAALDRQRIGEELLLDRLDAMSVEERRAYAARLEERIRRGWRR